ncbi:MAG TPA: fibronectin type III domain-containing protein [Bacteroidia bacterium]|jgi:hypothetical protein|nr:fibronectin type III domain-containing protein [Bacteroidia bacterium]
MSSYVKPRKFTALLKLKDKSIPQLIAEAYGIVDAMTGNPWFPVLSVPLTVVKQAIDKLVAAQTLAQTRARGTAAAMHVEAATVEVMLKQLAGDVTYVAGQNPDDGDAIIQSAHMYQRSKPVNPSNGYRVHATSNSGELFIMTRRVPHAGYEFEMSTDPHLESSWTTIYKGLKCKCLKTGLQSGTRYYIRVRTITNVGESVPSDVLSSVVL